MRLIIRLLLVLLVVSWATGLHAQDEEGLESYRLDNGLTVVIAPDHKVPKVAVTLQYRVGAVNEPAGRSGFAHLFEHLMYTGTPTYPSVDATLSALGLTYNASTYRDATVYHATGMASTLPVILSVHADQMANIGAAVTQSDLDLQRSVVLNEMRQNVLDSPGSSALTALQAGLFPSGHPYSRATIGSIADLEAATLDDVRAFFHAYYLPANAVLSIVGDVDPAATRALVADTFGRVAHGPGLMRAPVPDAVPTRVRIEDEDAVAMPMVYLAFSSRPTSDAEDAALYVAADLLSNESGPLHELVTEGVATFAAGGWMPGTLAGTFFFYGGAGVGVPPEELERRLRTAIASFAGAPIDPADFKRSRSAFVVSERTALESFRARSARIADKMATRGDLAALRNPAFDDVTAADVEATMQQVLIDADVSVAVVRSGARGDYPAVLEEASGTPQPIVADERATVAIPVLTAGEPAAATLPDRETATLSNGIRLVHYRMADAPMAYLSAVVSGGANNDPRGREGLHELATQMAARGAGDREEEDFAASARDAGAILGGWTGMTSSGVVLSVVPDNLSQGVDLLVDVLQAPRFDTQPWAVLKSGMRQYLAQRDLDPNSVASLALNRILYTPGPDDPEVDASLASIESISIDDAEAAYRTMFVPATMTVYSVSDLPLAAVAAALEERLGTWVSAERGLTPKAPLQPVFPQRQRVYLVPIAGASQATIHISRPAPGRNDTDYPDAITVTNLLASDFASRLNTVIREEKGFSYGVGGYLWGWLTDEGGLTVTIPVQADAAGAALAEALAGFESLASAPVSEAELGRSVMSYLTVQAGLPETAGGFFGALVSWEKEGVELDSLVTFLEQMSALELDKVRKVGAALAGLDRAVIVIAGDPQTIVPQLNSIGITKVETVDIAAPQ